MKKIQMFLHPDFGQGNEKLFIEKTIFSKLILIRYSIIFLLFHIFSKFFVYIMEKTCYYDIDYF